MRKILVGEQTFKVGYPVKALVELETETNIPMDSLLFDVEVTGDLQQTIVYYGLKAYTNKSRKQFNIWYGSLPENEKTLVDIICNGELLESFGVGGDIKSAPSSDTEDVPHETKYFKDYIMELGYFLFGVVGLSIKEFMNGTPVQAYKIVDAYYKGLEFNMHINEVANVNAYGFTHSKKYKAINPFNKDANSSTKPINPEFKQKELDFLFNKVGEE